MFFIIIRSILLWFILLSQRSTGIIKYFKKKLHSLAVWPMDNFQDHNMDIWIVICDWLFDSVLFLFASSSSMHFHDFVVPFLVVAFDSSLLFSSINISLFFYSRRWDTRHAIPLIQYSRLYLLRDRLSWRRERKRIKNHKLLFHVSYFIF